MFLPFKECYRNYRERKYSEYELSISSKISSVNEQNEIEEAMGDDIVSAPEEAEQKSGENVSQIKSADGNTVILHRLHAVNFIKMCLVWHAYGSDNVI